MRNIVICADLNEQSIERLRSVREDIDLKHAKVHLVHVFEIQQYISEFTPYVYPSKDQYADMEKSTKAILEKLSTDMGLNSEQVAVECFFAFSREDELKKYLEKVEANLVVVATRGKHGVEGLFSSSLTEFLIKYSPCDVLTLRPRK